MALVPRRCLRWNVQPWRLRRARKARGRPRQRTRASLLVACLAALELTRMQTGAPSATATKTAARLVRACAGRLTARARGNCTMGSGSEVNITKAAATPPLSGWTPRAGEGGAVFSPSPDSEARLRKRLEEEDASGALGFDAYVAVDACDGVLPHGGALIAQSTRPLVTAEECERIIAECEARAGTLGGWSTARHADECYATTDQPVRHLEQTAEWLRDSFLPDVAWPFVAHAFGFALQDARRDGAWPGVDGGSDAQVARAALRVSDAFVVKYNASAGQQG